MNICRWLLFFFAAAVAVEGWTFDSYVAPCVPGPSSCLDVRSFGAVGDGMTINTQAIQKAIDHVASLQSSEETGTLFHHYTYSMDPQRYKTKPRSTPCCVSVMAGDYLSADVSLRSNVFLHINDDAVLRLAINETQSGLIIADSISNAGVIGGGTLHGQAEFFVDSYQPYPDERLQPRSDIPRPHMIFIRRSDHITLQGLRIRNSSNWNVHLGGCTNVLVEVRPGPRVTHRLLTCSDVFSTWISTETTNSPTTMALTLNQERISPYATAM